MRSSATQRRGAGWGFVGGFGVDLDHGFAVEGDDLASMRHFPASVAAGCSERRWERAAAAENVEGGAFGFDGKACVGVFEEGDGVADVSVAGFRPALVLRGVWGCGFRGEGSLAGAGRSLRGRSAGDGLGALERSRPAAARTRASHWPCSSLRSGCRCCRGPSTKVTSGRRARIWRGGVGWWCRCGSGGKVWRAQYCSQTQTSRASARLGMARE